MLLAFRFSQAFMISALSVVTMTIICESLDSTSLNKAFSWVSGSLALAPTIGPLIGGTVVEHYSWQANFVLLLLLGALLFVISALILPETRSNKRRQNILQEMLLLSKKIRHDKRFVGYLLLRSLFNGIQFSCYIEAPFIFIGLFKISPAHYGRIGVFIALCSTAGGLISRLKHPTDPDKLIYIGICIMIFGSFLCLLAPGLAHYTPQAKNITILEICLALGVIFIGFGITVPNCLSKALSNYQSNLGSAGSIFGFSTFSIVSALTFLMGFIHNGSAYPMPCYFIVLSICMIVVYRLLINPKITQEAKSSTI